MNKRALVVGGGILAVGVVAVVATRLLYSQQNYADVTLSIVGGVCTPSVTGTLGERKGNKIIWNITNNCDTDQYVRFQDFKQRAFLGGSLGSPVNDILDPGQPTSKLIPRSGGTDTVDPKVNKDSFLFKTVYKYAVFVGPDLGSLVNRLDPDVEIWP